LTRRGFFDLITPGDEVILQPERTGSTPAAVETAANPELRNLLRTLR
jgi:hypothetical protein